LSYIPESVAFATMTLYRTPAAPPATEASRGCVRSAVSGCRFGPARWPSRPASVRWARCGIPGCRFRVVNRPDGTDDQTGPTTGGRRGYRNPRAVRARRSHPRRI